MARGARQLDLTSYAVRHIRAPRRTPLLCTNGFGLGAILPARRSHATQLFRKEIEMNYRRLGRSGLQVSELSLGSWVTYGNQVDRRAARESLAAARDAGVNFFDNAEVYAQGRSEEIMGQALKELAWPRVSYVVSTKFFWGLREAPNQYHTLNRKYLLDAIDGSLTRLQLDYVDLVFCHRPDPHTPIEETVWAMSDIVNRGKALYWGTSEWSAGEIRAAYEIAERHHLHKPVMEQPQYNLFWRKRVEQEYQRLYEDIGLGLTTWSPLASGLLTGKYIDGVPAGSRAEVQGYHWLRTELTDARKNGVVRELAAIAADIGCSVGQLAIAWVLKNPHVSTVITGASRVDQIAENMKAADIAAKLTPEVMQRIEEVSGELAR
jgi:voltage-dependent potassium channel beta subunit